MEMIRVFDRCCLDPLRRPAGGHIPLMGRKKRGSGTRGNPLILSPVTYSACSVPGFGLLASRGGDALPSVLQIDANL